MEEVKYITLNGFDFIITQELDFNNTHYMLAIDENGEDSVALLKQRIENVEEMVESVLDDDEIELVFQLFHRQNEGK